MGTRTKKKAPDLPEGKRKNGACQIGFQSFASSVLSSMEAEIQGGDIGTHNGKACERAKVHLARLSPEQLERYECYRRAKFPQSVLKKVLSKEGGVPITEGGIIAAAAAAKLFVGDLVETSRRVMAEAGDVGAIRPAHLREAHRRLAAAGCLPGTRAACTGVSSSSTARRSTSSLLWRRA